MKRVFIYIGLAVAIFYGSACQRMEKEAKQPTHFSTPEEAANKAKSDLLAVLRSGQKIALGVEEPTIEKSQPATPIKQYQITFEDLLSADTFTNLARNEMATVVPLVADGNVATIAEVAKDEQGWKVVSLADKSLSTELDVVRKAAGSQAEVVIYDLPHSGIKVYGLTQNAAGQPSGAVFYTNYPGFNLGEAVPAERLLPVLKRDAAEVQQKYGEELKRQKVVR